MAGSVRSRGSRRLVISPRDAGYDEARAIHNGLVDRRPALIVRCRTTATWSPRSVARSAGLEVSVRAAATTSPAAPDGGGVMISLADMTEVAGATERDGRRAGRRKVGRVQHRHRRARPGRDRGRHSTTGIAGLTLGGGLGWLMQARARGGQPTRGRARDRGRRGSRSTRARTRTFSGRCAAAAATSASSRRSRTACTRSAWSPVA